MIGVTASSGVLYHQRAEGLLAHHSDRLGTGVRQHDFVAGRFEPALEHECRTAVILDDQDTYGHAHLLAAHRSRIPTTESADRKDQRGCCGGARMQEKVPSGLACGKSPFRSLQIRAQEFVFRTFEIS
jgi:hypothetical protein